MKKILAALLVLALAIPAMADVAITATDAGSQQLQISFAGPANAVRGIALTVTVTNGTIESGAFISSDFNTFIDYAFTTGAGYTIGSGHPFALETTAGVAAFPIASGAPFAVSVGYLDQNSTKLGLTSGSVALIQISNIPNNESATVTFSANATRGGAVVGDAPLGDVTVQSPVLVAGQVVPTDKTLAMSAGPNGSLVEDKSGTYPVGTPVTIAATPNTYYNFAGWTGDTANIDDPAAASTTITMNADATIVANFEKKTCFEMLSAADQVEYNKYIAAGKTDADMVSWCWRFQCRGDADNAAYLPTSVKWQVYQADMNIMIAQWKKTYATSTNVAADFDHTSYLPTSVKWTVYQGDMNILVANWKKTAATLVECPSYLP